MRRRPIGQILVEKGEISEVDLQAALEEQDRTGRRLGEILIEQGRTSWLALARAMAEQVLDIQSRPEEAEVGREAKPATDPVELVRAMAEKVARFAPVPEPLPPPQLSSVASPPPEDPERELARAVAAQVAESAPAAETHTTHLLRLTPKTHSVEDPEVRVQTIEALLKDRQRAFIELFTTTETLRTKLARLEAMLEERDRELARLRVRAV